MAGPALRPLSVRRWRPRLRTNYFMWFALLIAFCAGVLVMRDQGRQLLSISHAREELNAGIDLYRGGKADEGQRLIARQVLSHPELWGETLDRLGMQVLGLPLVYGELQAYVDSGGGFKSTEALYQARAIVQGEETSAESGQALLWDGRAKLSAGDVFGAKPAFDAYWDRRRGGQRRAQAYQRILSSVESPLGAGAEEAAHLLLGMGLWDEAFALCAQAEGAGAGLRFFDGLQLELGGDFVAARSVYADLLGERPNHRLGRLRLDALSGAGGSTLGLTSP